MTDRNGRLTIKTSFKAHNSDLERERHTENLLILVFSFQKILQKSGCKTKQNFSGTGKDNSPKQDFRPVFLTPEK